jgi:hypothetical protein
MRARAFILLLAAVVTTGCLRYEYEHEFWLRVDGSGQVFVTGQPALWHAFKGVGHGPDSAAEVTTDAVRELFTRSGLRVKSVTLTHRGGRPYVFVSADFTDISRLHDTPAFPDLDVRLVHEGDRLRLSGTWRRPPETSALVPDQSGLMAVRFHLPSKVYEHKNAADGVERGNIVAWRQELGSALRGQPLELGAVMDERSILWSTVGLFGTAIGGAVVLLLTLLYWVFRQGRKATPSSGAGPAPK